MIRSLKSLKKFFSIKIENYSLINELPLNYEYLDLFKPTENHTKLSNGIKVFYETPEFPNYISFSILINGGTKSEGKENAGSLYWLKKSIKNYLKNNYLKIFNNTEINYCEDFFTIQFSCTSHQFNEFSKVLANCLNTGILSDNFLQNIEFDENNYFKKFIIDPHQKNDFQHYYDIFNKAAFGNQSYGLNKTDIKKNLEDKQTFRDNSIIFLNNLLNTTNISLGSSGILNSNEFLDILENNFSNINSKNSYNFDNKFDNNLYKGGELYYDFKDTHSINCYESDKFVKLGIGFETTNWNHKDSFTFKLISQIFGESSCFSTGGPGFGMFSLLSKKHNQLNFCTNISNFNLNYLNSGVFGLYVEVFKGYELLSINELLKILLNFKNEVTVEDLERSKKILKNSILFNLQNQKYRLESNLKNLNMYDNNMTHDQILKNIQDLDIDQVTSTLSKYLKNPTIAMMGENITKYTLKSKLDINFM